MCGYLHQVKTEAVQLSLAARGRRQQVSHWRPSSPLNARAGAGFKVRLVKGNLTAGQVMPPVRRLAAILAADVAGYSRLMGADEEGTHAAMLAVRRELGDPKIREHRGRIVKTTGDGLLVEFASVVDAVRCAVEVQREMIARNTDVPVERRLEFRMGINVGDIIIEDGDIFGDGVNIAARLGGTSRTGRDLYQCCGPRAGPGPARFPMAMSVTPERFFTGASNDVSPLRHNLRATQASSGRYDSRQ